MPLLTRLKARGSPGYVKFICGAFAFIMLLATSFFTGHHRKYGPLEIVSTVKRIHITKQSLIRSTDSYAMHLQLSGDLKDYSIPQSIPLERPKSRFCESGKFPKKVLFSQIEGNMSSDLSCSSLVDGLVFPAGRQPLKLTAALSTNLVYSFHNDILEDIKFHFSGWNGEVLALSSSFAVKENEVTVVSRIWLNKEKSAVINKNAADNKDSDNRFWDNYLVKGSYDLQLKKLVPHSVLTVNIPNMFRATSGDGPMDPKVYFHDDRLHIMFNAAVADSRNGELLDRMFLHTPDSGPSSVNMISLSNWNLAGRDKGWSPLISNGKIYFVYRFEPLIIAECNSQYLADPCTFFHNHETHANGSVNIVDRETHLRGGSPFVEYMYPYYVSVGHGTFFLKSGTRYYTTNIMLLNLQSKRFIYVSSDITFSKKLLNMTSPARPWVAAYPFFFTLGIHVSDPDELIVSGHFNDNHPAMVRISGVKEIFDTAIAEDIKGAGGFEKKSPSNHLNSLLLQLLKNETNLEFA